MSGTTGAVDVASDETVAALRTYGQFREAQGHVHPAPLLEASADGLGRPPLPPEVLDHLIGRGYLTSLTHDEERAHVAQLSAVLHEVQSARPVFLIVPNLDCNFRCTYCFERPLQNTLGNPANKRFQTLGLEASYARQNVVMTRHHVHLVYRAIQKIQAMAGCKAGGQIILYGGEPLDATNKDVVFHIVEQGRSSGFHFAAVTNGHDLDHFLPLLAQDGINQVQISIDGPKRVHDQRRILRGAGGSFDTIVANVNRVLAQGGTLIQLRVHVDPANLSDFKELVAFFDHQGWLNNSNVVVYVNTVYSKDSAGRVSARLDHSDIAQRLQDVTEPYENLFLNAPAVNARMLLLPSLIEDQPYRLKSTYCAANTGQYILAPDGHMYACWESVGKQCSRVGSYMTDTGEEQLAFHSEAVAAWFNRSSGRIAECLECPFGLVCGGGCAQYAQYNAADLYRPYCDGFDAVFRHTLAENITEFAKRMAIVARGEAPKAGLLERNYG